MGRHEEGAEGLASRYMHAHLLVGVNVMECILYLLTPHPILATRVVDTFNTNISNTSS